MSDLETERVQAVPLAQSVLTIPGSPPPPSDTIGYASSRSPRRAAWSIVACSAGIIATLVTAINCAVTIFAAQRIVPGSTSLNSPGLSAVSSGDCNGIERIDTVVHLVINLFATALICCSSYCMQSISAPTRTDIDKAHAQQRWLDVGIMSYRNIRWIGGRSLLCWSLLLVTTLPLHLFYNSTIFVAVPAREYTVGWVTKTFVERPDIPLDLSVETSSNSNIRAIRPQLSTYERLENRECIDAYGRPFVSDRGNVLVVAEPHVLDSYYDPDRQVLRATSVTYPRRKSNDGVNYDSYSWMCKYAIDFDTCYDYDDNCCFKNITNLKAHADDWHPYEYVAYYCMSQSTTPQCTLYINWILLAVVTGSCGLKTLCIFYVAFRKGRRETLATVGDAVQSFMKGPDVATRDMGLAGAEQFRGEKWQNSEPGRHAGRTLRWSSATSRGERLWCIASWITVSIVVFILLGKAVDAVSKGGNNAFSTGFGTITETTIITGWALESIDSRTGRVISAVLVANSPQLVLTILYFTVNRVMTAMTMGKEWNYYAGKALPLRTSSPRGEQIRSPVLSLPLKFAVPLALSSALLHWLISQSIFLAAVHSVNTSNVIQEAFLLATCGFSPVAIVCTIAVGWTLFAVVLVVFNFKLPNKMPVVQTCSAAIAAACHDPGYTPGDELRHIQWGEVEIEESSKLETEAVIGSQLSSKHYAFSARPVCRLRIDEKHT